VNGQWDQFGWVDQINKLRSNVELEPAYRGQVMFPVGYKAGPGPHGGESKPGFVLELAKAEPSRFKPSGPKAFNPAPARLKPRKPNPPKSKAKPNMSGKNGKSLPPNAVSRLKEAAPQSKGCAPSNCELPWRRALDRAREWENEEWPIPELPNRVCSKFDCRRCCSKEGVGLDAFFQENWFSPDQPREDDAADGGRLELNEEADRGVLAQEDWSRPDQLREGDAADGGRLELNEETDRGALAQEDWSRPDQPREGDATDGGRFELKEEANRGVLTQEDWTGRDQFLEADAAFGGRFDSKLMPGAWVPVARVLPTGELRLRPATPLALRGLFE
jgi:hypothetical protein